MKYFSQILYFTLLLFLYIRTHKTEKIDKNHSDFNFVDKNESDNFRKNVEKERNDQNQNSRKLDDEKNQPIRIYVDLTSIKKNFSSNNIYNLTIEEFENAVNEVTEVLKKLIQVSPRNGEKLKIEQSIVLEQNKFNSVDYDSSLVDPGKDDIDLIILMRFAEGDDSMDETTFAKPKIIQPSDPTKRPEVGIVILYPDYGLTESNKKEYLKYLFLHEFTHILGFTEEYIENILGKNEESIARIENSPTIKKLVITSTKAKKVLDHARTYFNCTEIEYLELEEQIGFEGDDLKNSHWDARLLLGEYMTSDPYFGDQVISEFTLFLLEDLGFYKTNKFTGGLMRFGKNRRCEFLKKDCILVKDGGLFPSLLTSYEFCDDGDNPTCSSGRQSRAYCVKIQNNNMDSFYTRKNSLFKENLYGRKNADYCYVSDVESEDDEAHYVGNCKLGNGNYGYNIGYDNGRCNNSYFDSTVGERYGNDSYCALSSLVHNDTEENGKPYKGRVTPKCYPMFCTKKSLTIQINNQYVVCPRSGGIVKEIIDYSGYLYCPEYNLICTSDTPCNNMFDCVEKNSTAKNETYGKDYEINEEGTKIQGYQSNAYIEYYVHSFVKGYELSNENSKCPLNCHQCLKNKQCIECSNTTIYVGTKENDNNTIKCENEVPTEPHYKKTNYNIGGIIDRDVYFNCMEGCKNCSDGKTCNSCYPTHRLNKATNICEESIPYCLEYDQDKKDSSGVYIECKNCSETEKYYCLNIDGDNDLGHCYEITNNTYIFKNVTSGHCYYRCEVNFPHCQSCNETECFECQSGFNLKNGICNWNPSDGVCNIVIKQIEDDLSSPLIPKLVKDYINSEGLSISKINHYENEKKDYTITIFMNSSCTEELLKYGYYSIDNDQITEQIKKDIYKNTKELPITVFITYGSKNYSLMVFSLSAVDITNQCSNCQDLNVEIRNNFSSIVNKTLGSIVLDSVKYGEFDVFNESAGEFTTICKNVTLLGIDAPLYRRKNYFYMHEFSNSYSCRADICSSTKKLFQETTAVCVCSKPGTFTESIKTEEFTFYNVSSSKSSKAGDAFKVFGCVEDNFNSRHIKKNFGFYFSLIVIILQIILFIIYCIAGKPINFSKGTVASTSAPPKRIAMKINADWIKANLLNDHDEEKDIQSKDEIDDEFVMEEFNYNIDKHDTSSYSVDTDLAKKQIGDNKDTEKEGLTEKPDGKKKKKILILLPDKTKPEEDSNMLDDDLLPSKDKKQEKKNFFQIYWIILSLKQHIINYFSGFKWLKITESYVPKFIMGIRSLFMIVFVFFVNAMFLSQDYYDKKFTHFNQKYSLVPGYGKIKISGSEKFNYGFSHTAAYAFYTFLIFLIVQLIFGIFVFSVRKELTELFNSKDVLKINSLAKTLKAKYIVYFVIVIILMIAFFIYLTNFNGIYGGSGNDFGPAGLLSLIFIEIFPFIWSLILAIFRYFGIACQSKVLYGISQVFMF